jgi:hypothetical protein
MAKNYIYSSQLSLLGHKDVIGFGDGNFYIQEIEKEISNKIIIENHYSHKVAGYATTYIYLGVYENGLLLGTLQYGFAMNPYSAKNIVLGTGIYDYLELNRMWLSDEIKTSFPESQAISMSIKYIKKRFPKVKWVQSFADERCGGFGIVYQACSFCYYGEHLAHFWELDGVMYHKIALTHIQDSRTSYQFIRENKDRAKRVSLRQFRYIKFLDPRKKNECTLKEYPYPKHYQ